MPYDRTDDWARKLKMKTTGMFSTPSYFGVGEPYEDGFQSERPRRPSALQLWRES